MDTLGIVGARRAVPQAMQQTINPDMTPAVGADPPVTQGSAPCPDRTALTWLKPWTRRMENKDFKTEAERVVFLFELHRKYISELPVVKSKGKARGGR